MNSAKQNWVESVMFRHLPTIGSIDELESVPRLLEDRGGEFCATTQTDTAMVAAALAHGYIPMGERIAGHEVLFVKCHTERCVISPQVPRPSRNTIRASSANGWVLQVDQDLDAVVAGIRRSYAPNVWITDTLARAFAEIHDSGGYPTRWGTVSIRTFCVYPAGRTTPGAARDQRPPLVAGEIGAMVGGLYTSLSGFHDVSESGNAQLGVLSQLLCDAGATVWDLGMPAPYKHDMGCRSLDREAFLNLQKSLRAAPAPPIAHDTTHNCEELLRRRRHPAGRGRGIAVLHDL